MKGQIADKLNTEERCELKDEDFRYAPEDKKEELARRILMKARKFGVNIQSPTILEWDQEKSGR